MKKFLKTISFALAVVMVLTIINPVNASAKTTDHWRIKSRKYYSQNSETGKLEKSSEGSYTYDKKGNTTKYVYKYSRNGVNTTATTTYKHNSKGLITEHIYKRTENGKELTDKYTYKYKDGLLSEIKLNGKAYEKYTYEKKKIKKIVTKTSEFESVENYKNGKISTSTYKNFDKDGKVTYKSESKYDSHEFMTSQTTTDSQGNVSKTTYKNSYDKNGNITKVVSESKEETEYGSSLYKATTKYETSGVAKGWIKSEVTEYIWQSSPYTYTDYVYNEETGEYTEVEKTETYDPQVSKYEYEYKYTIDKTKKVVTKEECKDKATGKVVSKTEYEYIKLNY